MDSKLLKKHIEAAALAVVLPELLEDNSNIRIFFCADVVGNRRFAQNYGGYPRSEIAEINEQASLVTAQNLLRDLNVFEPTNENAGLSDAQIMLGHKSKYMQTASESVEWIEGQLQIRDAQSYAKQHENDAGSTTIDFTENSNSDFLIWYIMFFHE